MSDRSTRKCAKLLNFEIYKKPKNENTTRWTRKKLITDKLNRDISQWKSSIKMK